MHDNIERVWLQGEIDSKNLVEAKDRMVHFLETQMRDEGLVPCLDLEPQFTRDYDASKNVYNFELSVYGIKVGKQKAWEVAGIMGGKTITRSTPPVRSKQS